MRRVLIALPVAFGVTMALFSFMAWMVDNSQRKAPDATEALSFNMVMVENEQQTQRRQRSLPEPPEKPEVLPQTEVTRSTSSVEQAKPMSSLQPMGLDTAVEGVAVSAPQFGGFGVTQQVMPLYRVEPRYPPRAQKRRLEGTVVLSFTIDASGRTTDIKVMSANPEGVFEREAIRALTKWKYQPQMVDGEGVAQPGQTVNIEFKMDK
ncbi:MULTISPECIES: energy transducer TonB [unclassified Vibrio]|mgnify:FL=1|uniref:energy transducer TonB n=1 Tax=unclassified Vibrio TaxID=2614977 RepID=UPI001361327A|nr:MULTISPECIES: energy transducer TonB [unclassified Vibrio]NAW57205.1 TonB family protein [Vibrio sp. V36_P2S2PM302]NAX26284.1 TonB family protein [Vibrio sp. V38_P2S17PM301]NAX28544.1 TonB family protein [Vibrio sp. V37_P2S8PM304]